MKSIIDFHAHIFPDRIAEGALASLAEHSGEYQPCTDATLCGLLASMDRAGIGLSVVANIATRPAQLESILRFSQELMSDRVYPLVSFHPGNTLEEVKGLLRRCREHGLAGVKLHPMYQEFAIDEERMFPYYESVLDAGGFVLFHTGYDIAFPGNTQADIERVRRLARRLPDLPIVATHTGGWRQWDRIGQLEDCPHVYTDISMTLSEMDDDVFIRLLAVFGEDRVLFGTDSPWTDQKEMVERINGLPLSDGFKEKIFSLNAIRFLGAVGVEVPAHARSRDQSL